MFGKLALRNVRRSARDYLVYVLTMTFVVSLMFAFNSIIFSKGLQKMYEMAAIMAAMIGIATFFIVLIVAWLINYMVRFMLEKRSREFGIYLLIGMNKKEVSGLYMKENLLLGVCSFVIGLGLGMLLQQVLHTGGTKTPSGIQWILFPYDCVLLCRMLSAGTVPVQPEIPQDEHS